MARNERPPELLEPLKSWGFLIATYLGYFSGAGRVVYVVRTLAIPNLLPQALKRLLLSSNHNADFWILLAFTAPICIFFIWLIVRGLWRENPEEPDPQKDTLTKAIETAFTITERNHRWRIIRSFGLLWLREWLLDRMDIRLYGTFMKSSNWPHDPDRSNYVDRLTFKNGTGIEVQYASDYSRILARTHSADSDTFGETESRLPTVRETEILLFASNYFPFWWAAFLIKRLLCCRTVNEHIHRG